MEEKKVEEEQKKTDEEPISEPAEGTAEEETGEAAEEPITEEPKGEEKTEEIAEEKEEEKIVEEVAEAEGEEELAPAEEEEEAKPPSREKKVEEEEIVEERTYTVPLSKAWIMPPRKRTPRAVRMLRSFLVKHMKLEAREGEGEEEEPKRLIISNEVNERIWGRGIEKPPRKIRIRAAKDKEGNVTVYLAEGD
jgi:large subunit ribosomal protein L31e